MSMGTILVHLEEHAGLQSVLTTALLAATRFGAYISGLHVRPGMPRLVPVAPEGAFIPATEIVEDLERADRELSRRLREAFDLFMREHEVPVGRDVLVGERPVADWQEEVSPGTELLGSLGRVFDLIVVGRPVAGSAAPSMSALETALFESGRPVLIAPPGTPQSLGRNVVIAWNGSTETARTIAMTMPFLAQAEQVLVLSVEEGMVPGPSGAEVAQNLVRNRIQARSRHAQAGGRAVGAAILQEAAAAGADLLLKGAYTHSRLRQMIFGGATSHILGAAEIAALPSQRSAPTPPGSGSTFSSTICCRLSNGWRCRSELHDAQAQAPALRAPQRHRQGGPPRPRDRAPAGRRRPPPARRRRQACPRHRSAGRLRGLSAAPARRRPPLRCTARRHPSREHLRPMLAHHVQPGLPAQRDRSPQPNHAQPQPPKPTRQRPIRGFGILAWDARIEETGTRCAIRSPFCR